MSFSSNRHGVSRFSGRDGRERSDGKDRSEEQDRRNSRGSGRERSPRGPGGHDYPGSRRSPARRSPRRGDRSSPMRRSSPRRSPIRRSSPRRSPQGGSRSSSFRLNSYPGEREQFPSEPFKRDLQREPPRDMPRGAAEALMPDASKLDNARVPHRCELVVMDVDGRQCMYAEHIRMRLNEFGLVAEVVMLPGDANVQTIQGAVQDAYRRQILIACVINEQNAVHRSLTVNLLIGQQQEHRNMPLDSAIGLMMRTYEQWSSTQGKASGQQVAGNQQGPPPGQARGTQALMKPSSQVPGSEVFKKPDENIIRMLRMVIDGRNLVVEELDEIVEYFQDQRNRLASARGIAPLKPPPNLAKGGDSPVVTSGGNQKVGFEDERHGLQDKILGMLKSDPSLYQVLKGIDPSGATIPQGLRLGEGLPHGLQMPDKLLNLFQDKHGAASLGTNKPPQRKEPADLPAVQRFGPSSGNSLLGEPPLRMGSASLGGPSGGQDFKGLQDKIMDMFQGRDSKPSVGQGSSSYADQYMTSQPKEFGQTRSGYGNESSGRSSDRPGILGTPYGGGEVPPSAQRSDFSDGRYQKEFEKPGILGNPYAGDGMSANGRTSYRPPGDFPSRGPQSGNALQFAGGNFNLPPPGFVDSAKPPSGYRDTTRQDASQSQMQATTTPEWMQKQQAPPQRYSRFS